MGLIYKCTNLINNKSYIGMTTKPTFEKRKEKHIKDSKYECRLYFHRALQKYGLDSFEWSVVEFDIKNEYLGERERFWIKHYNTYYLDGFGYNMTLGGEDAVMSNKIHPRQVQEIIRLLEKTDLPQGQIGEKFGLTASAICDINIGKSWHDSKRKYPVRKLKTKKPKRLSEKEKEEVLCLLKTTNIHREDIANAYSVELSVINRVNNKHKIRDNVGAKRKISLDDFYKIVNLLKNTKITAVKIAESFNINPNTILDIDKGRTWSRYYDGEYPIRKKEK